MEEWSLSPTAHSSNVMSSLDGNKNKIFKKKSKPKVIKIGLLTHTHMGEKKLINELKIVIATI